MFNLPAITWTLPTDHTDAEVPTARIGTVEGSDEQFWMSFLSDGTMQFARRTNDQSSWQPLTLDFTDFAAAVQHRREVEALDGYHPDEVNERLNRNLAALDSLASAIHEADWNMRGPRWTWGDATLSEKMLARTQARKVAFVEAANDDADVARMVETALYLTMPVNVSDACVKAKTEKALAWLTINPEMCDKTQDPTTVPVRSIHDYSPRQFTQRFTTEATQNAEQAVQA